MSFKTLYNLFIGAVNYIYRCRKFNDKLVFLGILSNIHVRYNVNIQATKIVKSIPEWTG